MSEVKIPVVTIDGPSGAGKGTLCTHLAEHLGWHLLDSGAIYRIVALAALKANIALDDVTALITLTKQINIQFKLRSSQESAQVLLDNQDVTKEVRTSDTGNAASIISAYPTLREALLATQRAFVQMPGLIADGRDMGTVVFTRAPLKIFLTASVEQRANRRFVELQDKGINVTLCEVLNLLKERDARDTNRSVAPLKPAEDAVIIDTTHLTRGDVFKKALQLIKDKSLI